MHGDAPAFETINHWVTIFVGDLGPDELLEYLDEPGGVPDDEPFSRFAADLDCWYDHDFNWGEASTVPVPVRELCRSVGVDSERLTQEIVERTGPRDVRCLLLLWNARALPAGLDRTYASGRVRCLGAKNAPS